MPAISRPWAMHLGDFTVTPRVLLICALGLPLGALSAVVALPDAGVPSERT